MTDYRKCFNGGFIRRQPKFELGEVVYNPNKTERYIVKEYTWNSFDNEIRYGVVDQDGRRISKAECELIRVTSADRYKKYMQQQQQRLLLNSFYGINYYNLMGVKKVIFNAPATIVLWNDGTKTVVKCSENDIFDPEKGLAFCFLKKLLGNHYYKTIKSEVDKYDEETLTDIESTSIVNNTLKSIADNLKADLTNFGNGEDK